MKNQYEKPTDTSQNLDVNDLFNHFKTLFNTDTEQQQEQIDKTIIVDKELDCEISLSELKTAVFSQNNNKSR